MLNSKIQSGSEIERTWIQKAVAGDLDAFNELVLAYQNLAYHHAYTLLGDPAMSEDAVQESFIKAFENIAGFRGGSLRAWLLKIVTNAAYDFLRRSRRHPTQPLFPEDDQGDEIENAAWLADPTPSVQATVEHNEEANRLYQLVDELPEVYRTVLTLIDIQALDYTEAATVLNVPLGTVKSRLARARLHLKELLENDSKYSGILHTPRLVAARQQIRREMSGTIGEQVSSSAHVFSPPPSSPASSPDRDSGMQPASSNDRAPHPLSSPHSRSIAGTCLANRGTCSP